MLSRFKSPVVWLGVLAQVALIIALVNPDVSNIVKIVGASVIEIATLFGFLNNPTNPSGL